MFQKNDILPLSLAFISTVLIVTIGLFWLRKNNLAGFDNGDLNKSRIDNTSKVQGNNINNESKKISKRQSNLVIPEIVPEGTSVTINGAKKFNQINRALRKSFHQQYPGTVIRTEADGNDQALDLLYSGEIDILALDRPLNKAEQDQGLVAIPLDLHDDHLNGSRKEHNLNMYYVYQKPLNPNVEAFLGYALSNQGQKAISNH